MTDGRDFTWSAKAQDKVCDLIEEGLYGDRWLGAIIDDIFNYLLPIVKDALAAEYDRGYETALKMETDLQKDGG